MKRKHEGKLEMIIIKKRKVNRNIYNQDGRGLQTNCIWFYGTYVLNGKESVVYRTRTSYLRFSSQCWNHDVTVSSRLLANIFLEPSNLV